VHKKSCEAQIVHFGQIPPQLFEKPHVRRGAINDSSMSLRILNTYTLMNKLKEIPLGI
jgi:hypothetical protein